MINLEIIDITIIIAFWLAFVRFSAILSQTPIFDNTGIPVIIKTLVCLVLVYSVFPIIRPEIIQDMSYVGDNHFWSLTVFNMIVGLSIGYLVKSIMYIYLSAGTIITQQMGFSALKYFDPTAGTRIGPFEKLIQWCVLVLVISTGALIPIFKGIIISFKNIHIFDWGGLSGIVPFFLNIFKTSFASALMLASPLIFINILIMAILGIVARTVPQMNVLMVSFVINIGIGFLIFLSVSTEFFYVSYDLYIKYLGEWFQFIS
jgi:flagellar biosynthetic protein FliR